MHMSALQMKNWSSTSRFVLPTKLQANEIRPYPKTTTKKPMPHPLSSLACSMPLIPSLKAEAKAS